MALQGDIQEVLVTVLNEPIDDTHQHHTMLRLRTVASNIASPDRAISEAIWQLSEFLFSVRPETELWENGAARFATALGQLNLTEIPQDVINLVDDILPRLTLNRRKADLLELTLSAHWQISTAREVVDAALLSAEEIASGDVWSRSFRHYLRVAAGIANFFRPPLSMEVKERLGELSTRIANYNSFVSHRFFLDVADTAVRFLKAQTRDQVSKMDIDTYISGLQAAVAFFEAEENLSLIDGALIYAMELHRIARDPAGVEFWWWRLAEHYERVGDAKATEKDVPDAPLVATHFYKQGIAVLRNPPEGVNQEEKRDRRLRLKKKIVDANRRGISSMATFSSPIAIPADICDTFFTHIETAPTAPERLSRLVTSLYIPDIDALKSDIEGQSKLLGELIVQTAFISEDGHPMARGLGAEYDMNQIIIRELSIYVGSFLRPLLRRLRDRSLLSVQDVFNAFGTRHLLDENRTEQFGRGLTYWFNECAIEGIYLLIPELEAMLRRCSGAQGADVLAEQRDGTFHHISVDSAIERAKETFLPADLARLFSVVLTRRGANLRHKVCHGFVRDGALSIAALDSVAVCLLHLLRSEPPKDEDATETEN